MQKSTFLITIILYVNNFAGGMIVIPISVEALGYYAFRDCGSLEYMYCEVKSQPVAWNSEWKYNCPAQVVWGYNGN